MSFGQRSRGGSLSPSNPPSPTLDVRGISLRSSERSSSERSSPRSSGAISPCHAPHLSSASASQAPASSLSSPAAVVPRSSSASNSGPTAASSLANPNFRRPSERARAPQQPPSRNVVHNAMPATTLFSGRSNYPFRDFVDFENEWDRTVFSCDSSSDNDEISGAPSLPPGGSASPPPSHPPPLHMQGDAWVSANAYDDATDSESDDGAPHRAARGAVSRAAARLAERAEMDYGGEGGGEGSEGEEGGVRSEGDEYEFNPGNFQVDTDDDEAGNDAGDNWTDEQLLAEVNSYWLAHDSILDPELSLWPASRVAWLNDCIVRRQGMPLFQQRRIPTRDYSRVNDAWLLEGAEMAAAAALLLQEPSSHHRSSASPASSSRSASREAQSSPRSGTSSASLNPPAGGRSGGCSPVGSSSSSVGGGSTSRCSSASGGARRRQSLAESCVVCFECFEGRAAVVELSCRHVFHRRCLTTWLMRAANCPICRMAIDVDELVKEEEGREVGEGALQGASRDGHLADGRFFKNEEEKGEGWGGGRLEETKVGERRRTRGSGGGEEVKGEDLGYECEDEREVHLSRK